MKTRNYWGTPHTETGVDAFEAAVRARLAPGAAEKFAAAAAVEKALEHIARKSVALIQVQALFAIVTLILLATKMTPAATPLFMQLNRGSFVLALLSCLLLLPNLFLVSSSASNNSAANPRDDYLFAMGIHKMRAPRYTIALVMALAAWLLALGSLTQLA